MFGVSLVKLKPFFVLFFSLVLFSSLASAFTLTGTYSMTTPNSSETGSGGYSAFTNTSKMVDGSWSTYGACVHGDDEMFNHVFYYDNPYNDTTTAMTITMKDDYYTSAHGFTIPSDCYKMRNFSFVTWCYPSSSEGSDSVAYACGWLGEGVTTADLETVYDLTNYVKYYETNLTSSYTYTTNTSYQELANQTSTSGTWTNAARAYDASWTLFATSNGGASPAYFYENYTVIAGANIGSLYQTKLNATTYNQTSMFITYPGCWNTTKVQFRFESYSTATSTTGACWDNSAGVWNNFTTVPVKTIYETGMWWSDAYLNPFVQNVAISPDPAYNTTNLTCSYDYIERNSTDADYSFIDWYVNGNLALSNSTTLTTDYFNVSQNVSCNITPYDGVQNGTMVSDEITISISTCEYYGAGTEDWHINSNQGCNITIGYDLPNYNIYINGTGTVHFNSSINVSDIILETASDVIIDSDARILITSNPA